MSELNPHSAYLDERIRTFRNSKWEWEDFIIGRGTTHKAVMKLLCSHLFTDIVHNTFSAAYMRKHPCSDCSKPSQQRCHGRGESRPILLRRALKKVWPDTSKDIKISLIIFAFLEDHKYTQFTFKCIECHKNETNQQKRLQKRWEKFVQMHAKTSSS